MTRTKKQSQPLIAPSILSADFSRLADEIRDVENGGADWLHVDVMDGHFVPNLTFGPLVVEAIKPITQLPIDCHLMVQEPEKWIGPFAKAGAHFISIHSEATPHLDRALHQIREAGSKVGVAINPGTPLVVLEEVLELLDLVLVMSVNPGFGGQKFIETSLSKVRRLAEMRDALQQRTGSSFLIEVDGGVIPKNISLLRSAGADVFVAGSAIFSKGDRKQAIAELRSSMGEGNGSRST